MTHGMQELFAQLGLAAGEADIDSFVSAHSLLRSSLALADAPFWTPGQAEFLREGVLLDADWAGVIDALNERLCGRS